MKLLKSEEVELILKMRINIITLLFLVSIFSSCKKEHVVPQYISNVFPEMIRIEDLKPVESPYFNLIDYDLENVRSRINKKRVKKYAKDSYKSTMNYTPDSSYLSSRDSFYLKEQAKFKNYSKKKIIDSILIPEYFNSEFEGLIFLDLANKPYFDDKYTEIKKHPDSIAKENWSWLRNKLKQFNNSEMLLNFDKIQKKTNSACFEVPYGLLLLRNQDQYCWYIPIGWEYSDFQEKENDTLAIKNYFLGHIQGYIYNFNFFKELYEFHCM